MTANGITLCRMTRELWHALYRDWENDPALWARPELFVPYRYDRDAADRRFEALQEPSRVVFAILREGRPIGEVQLKRIDRERRVCTLSIHLQSDAVKGRGFGTAAERLALQYAFAELDLLAVEADALVGNVRSQRVLEKVGFRIVREADGFRHYRCDRPPAR